MDCLSLSDIRLAVGEREIVKGVDLSIKEGEIHILMGPNGSGKSTLAAGVMGSPHVTVVTGHIEFRGEDITAAAPEERARRGLYLGFQYPVELPGVGMMIFLRSALAARGDVLASEDEFRAHSISIAASIGLKEELVVRDVNVGFSGGEKKRNELVQLGIIKPRLAILDEYDSGLDVEGISMAAGLLRRFIEEEGRSLLVITHSGAIVDLLDPAAVHVMREGRIVAKGGRELVHRVAERGFEMF